MSKKGMPDNQGKMVRNGTPKTVDCPGKSDGGGSADIAAAAKAINKPKSGGAPGV
jgi:hypothetical protein